MIVPSIFPFWLAISVEPVCSCTAQPVVASCFASLVFCFECSLCPLGKQRLSVLWWGGSGDSMICVGCTSRCCTVTFKVQPTMNVDNLTDRPYNRGRVLPDRRGREHGNLLNDLEINAELLPRTNLLMSPDVPGPPNMASELAPVLLLSWPMGDFCCTIPCWPQT